MTTYTLDDPLMDFNACEQFIMMSVAVFVGVLLFLTAFFCCFPEEEEDENRGKITYYFKPVDMSNKSE